MPERCAARCMATATGQPRPHLVKVTMNRAARDELALRTGQTAPDQIVCTNMECGGLMQALQALAPLQELVK